MAVSLSFGIVSGSKQSGSLSHEPMKGVVRLY